MRFHERADQSELMDDLSRPDQEFVAAYRELEIINRWLGGIRAIERFLPAVNNPLILDVAAGGCDVSAAIATKLRCRMVVLDQNTRGLRFTRKCLPVAADALNLPFADASFDIVMTSLFFHHLSKADCTRLLTQMWRISKRLVVVNDLHRHALAYSSIRVLTALFSNSGMVKHDAPVSVRRAFRPRELLDIADAAGVPARVYRSFPYRLVLVAEK
jgi:ubiquinone/menaquinone biosynthesis C-methylase UbiE